MDPATLDRLCQEALQRIHYFINRSAAQHLRRMRESVPPITSKDKHEA